MKLHRSEAGFVLQVVLGAIVILLVTGSFLYVRTEEHLQMSAAVRLQAIASSRATLAAEQVIAQFKRQTPLGLSSLGPCRISEDLAACASGGRVISVAS